MSSLAQIESPMLSFTSPAKKRDRQSVGARLESNQESFNDIFSENSIEYPLISRPDWCHDIWSFGVIVMYIILAQNFEENMLMNIPEKVDLNIYIKERLFPKLMEYEVELVEYCLFESRPSIQCIKEMNFFEDISWNYVMSKPIIPITSKTSYLPEVKPLTLQIGSNIIQRRRGATFHFLDAVQSLSNSKMNENLSKSVTSSKMFSSRLSFITIDKHNKHFLASKDLDAL